MDDISNKFRRNSISMTNVKITTKLRPAKDVVALIRPHSYNRQCLIFPELHVLKSCMVCLQEVTEGPETHGQDSTRHVRQDSILQ